MSPGAAVLASSDLHQAVAALVDRGPVLDVCCRDGRLLDALAERSIDAVGLDDDPTAVDSCRARGLTVYQLRWQDYLHRLVPGTLGAVFASQRVLRIDRAEAIAFLRSAAASLTEGAPAIIDLAPEIHDQSARDEPARGPVADLESLTRAARAEGFDIAVHRLGSRDAAAGRIDLLVATRGTG